ncbi:MAG: DUF2497 domain-containing protein [Pseudomonadota bacterium]
MSSAVPAFSSASDDQSWATSSDQSAQQQQSGAQQPSMEDILASIRRIIDEGANSAPDAPSQPANTDMGQRPGEVAPDIAVAAPGPAHNYSAEQVAAMFAQPTPQPAVEPTIETPAVTATLRKVGISRSDITPTPIGMEELADLLADAPEVVNMHTVRKRERVPGLEEQADFVVEASTDVVTATSFGIDNSHANPNVDLTKDLEFQEVANSIPGPDDLPQTIQVQPQTASVELREPEAIELSPGVNSGDVAPEPTTPIFRLPETAIVQDVATHVQQPPQVTNWPPQTQPVAIKSVESTPSQMLPAAEAVKDSLLNSLLDEGGDALSAGAERLLRPIVRQWVDDNLATMVERIVREEIERISQGE